MTGTRISSGAIFSTSRLTAVEPTGTRLRAAQGTTITDTITMRDTDKLTGPGTFTNVNVSPGSGATVTQDNTITDTNLSGKVTLDASTGSTTIKNVNVHRRGAKYSGDWKRSTAVVANCARRAAAR